MRSDRSEVAIEVSQGESAVLNEVPATHNDRLNADPEWLCYLSPNERFSFEREELAEIQLAGLRRRFDDLVDKIPVLKKFAQEQGLSKIDSLEDGALLLFPHTVYKSYPNSAVEKGRCDQLTKWLNTLTAVDLSGVDVSGCNSIDTWVKALDEQTELRITHTSGTSGKMSFTPFHPASEGKASTTFYNRSFETFDGEPRAGAFEHISEMPMINFAYRYGANAPARNMQNTVDYVFGGDESMVVALYPGRLSADIMSLGGRLKGAAARGELGKAAIGADLMARREAFLKEQAELPERIGAILKDVEKRFRGRRVMIRGVVPMALDVAKIGLAMGIENLFAPDSIGVFTGGAKGRDLPPDYKQILERFTGMPYPTSGFGMSESPSSFTRMCPQGRYHMNPSNIPYLLDAESGEPFPRTGRHVGRFGIIDLLPTTRWGGYLTGDEVTLDWGDSEPCPCGRKGAYIESNIRRYGEKEGGDDKITCAGSPEVHDKALEFITSAYE
jgi:hypothetical protein